MSMGATGGAEERTGGAPAGVETPAGAPSPGAPSGGGAPAQGAEAGGSAQPSAAPEPPKQTDVDEPRFPWSAYRKTQSEAERATRERDQAIQQAQSLQQEKAQWAAERAALAQRAADYDALATIIEKDPDFAAELERRLAGHTSTPRAAAAAAALPPEFLKEWKETKQRQDEMYTAWQQQQEWMRQEQERQQLDALGRQLDGQLTGLMKERNYSEELLPMVRTYVINRIAQLGNVKAEEVPYVFGEWHRLQENAFNQRMQQYVKGGQAAAAALPASPGGAAAQPAIQGKVDTDGFGPKSKQQLEEGLKRLGWQ